MVQPDFVSIITVVSSIVSLPKSLEDSVKLFNGATKFEDRFRTLQLTIMNNLPHSLDRESDRHATHFDSGLKFDEIPPNQVLYDESVQVE
jgi:hypothetical protein